MDRTAFFAALRGSALFPHGFEQPQVDGITRLLDVWEEGYRGPVDELGYDLATSFHETAATMQPIEERGARSYFDKYEPGTKLGKVLGNTHPGDGYRFKGAGDVQNTGRRNARFASERLNAVFGLGVDLEAHPEMRLDPTISAHSLFLGNREGWWTGKKLDDYLDHVDETDSEDLREWTRARYVVNGTDKAAKIAGYALVFEGALKAAGYAEGAEEARPAAAAQTVLKKGAKGEAVRTLQEALGAAGFKVAIDGDFGARTDAAVRAFQKARGLDVDGRVGPYTWAALADV